MLLKTKKTYLVPWQVWHGWYSVVDGCEAIFPKKICLKHTVSKWEHSPLLRWMMAKGEDWIAVYTPSPPETMRWQRMRINKKLMSSNNTWVQTSRSQRRLGFWDGTSSLTHSLAKRRLLYWPVQKRCVVHKQQQFGCFDRGADWAWLPESGRVWSSFVFVACKLTSFCDSLEIHPRTSWLLLLLQRSTWINYTALKKHVLISWLILCLVSCKF